jgi:hypothetical protein
MADLIDLLPIDISSSSSPSRLCSSQLTMASQTPQDSDTTRSRPLLEADLQERYLENLADNAAAMSASASPSNHSTIVSKSARPQPYWGIYWAQPVLMVSSGLLGILLAIGHHAYYSKLNGTLASTPEKQQWPIGFGTAFSISAVMCLGVAISEACTQCLWARVRSEAMSIRSIDSMFSVTRNPFAFLSVGVKSAGPWFSLLIIIFWLAIP